ncbi:hypothetical protein J1N35_012555 [Gossypium stocksii]|uniref:Uncharacterized protein n=1 Tax=Gossypium stocksii TaxID=47602 RepID=A0A9D3W4S8_9ROSI|nr:hypothetical protein J1N35_012555 [Gossypium stocksii]
MNLTFLKLLNLSKNNLIGPIPHEKQFYTFDNDSYDGNIELYSRPLIKQCVNHEWAELPTPLVVDHEGSKVPLF